MGECHGNIVNMWEADVERERERGRENESICLCVCESTTVS